MSAQLTECAFCFSESGTGSNQGCFCLSGIGLYFLPPDSETCSRLLFFSSCCFCLFLCCCCCCSFPFFVSGMVQLQTNAVPARVPLRVKAFPGNCFKFRSEYLFSPRCPEQGQDIYLPLVWNKLRSPDYYSDHGTPPY